MLSAPPPGGASSGAGCRLAINQISPNTAANAAAFRTVWCGLYGSSVSAWA